MLKPVAAEASECGEQVTETGCSLKI